MIDLITLCGHVFIPTFSLCFSCMVCTVNGSKSMKTRWILSLFIGLQSIWGFGPGARYCREIKEVFMHLIESHSICIGRCRTFASHFHYTKLSQVVNELFVLSLFLCVFVSPCVCLAFVCIKIEWIRSFWSLLSTTILLNYPIQRAIQLAAVLFFWRIKLKYASSKIHYSFTNSYAHERSYWLRSEWYWPCISLVVLQSCGSNQLVIAHRN